ncbi:MAG: hypothetical protein LBG19_13340 [Prevotellaceae bacterium]|jgi:hypothetical protein|nr:hypothetical protein [Prevotellaceae bacterium]
MKIRIFIGLLFLLACYSSFAQQGGEKVKGTVLAQYMSNLSAEEREAFVEECIASGSYPSFMDEFVRIDIQAKNEDGSIIKGYYFVAPDYLSIGTEDDFIRMPIQPTTAQRIADKKGCFLSTRKICNDIYNDAIIRLEPHPLTNDRDSLRTFIEHNSIIEKQRKGYLGLIAGHKKDVIVTHRLYEYPKNGRVALYGWHKTDGTPIQPIYIGHVDWYVDYSHGIRLVKDTIYVEGRPMHYVDVMKHPVYSGLICDEDICDYYVYPVESDGVK